jgi:hypothetical protein
LLLSALAGFEMTLKTLIAWMLQAILQEDLMVQRIQTVIPFSPVPNLNCTMRVGKVRPQSSLRSHSLAHALSVF